ncbi:portal protein [Bacterioplanoides sp.]|uniref:portal protein n=1 Tax=Bacterioplanoides sp. TaxID=2066072 RepID=UPI003B59F126
MQPVTADTSQPAMSATDFPETDNAQTQYPHPPETQFEMEALGLWLRARFDEVKGQRHEVEDCWLQDLRQYKGLYESAEWQKLKEEKRRSKLFSRMTRRKVKAYDSRMMEMLFPSGKDRNWSLKSTPEPDVVMTPVTQEMITQRQTAMFQEQVQQIAQERNQPPEQVAQMLQQGGYVPELDSEELRHIAIAVARSACDRMSTTIADQMAELNYKANCKKVLHSGHIFGAGILKAPLAIKHMRPKWAFDGRQWFMEMTEKLMPYIEWVPVWAWYPDPAARCIEDMEFCFQRHVMTRHQVTDLTMRPNFNQELISYYLSEYPDGDAEPMNYEVQLDAQNTSSTSMDSRTDRRYEVLEFWGVLSNEQLRDIGIETDPMEAFWVQAWVIGHQVIRFGAAPIEGMDHPYHIYHFEEDESSIWGEGVPAIIRDDQSALNATMRAMMDNMASTVGAQYEVNTDLLHPSERVRDIWPNRVWFRRGDSRYPALRSVEVNSRIQEFLALKGTFETQIHENTLPAFMQGQQSGGAGRTASGLSMLMGSANLDVKDQITNFDLGITRPVVSGFYKWNMQFNDDPYIKGDFEIIAKGSSSLVAKELRAGQLDQLLPLLSNPQYGRYIDARKLLEEIFKVRDLLDTEILLSPQEYDEREALRNQIQQQQQQLQKLTELLDKLYKQAPALVRQAADRLPKEAFTNAGMAQQG